MTEPETYEITVTVTAPRDTDPAVVRDLIAEAIAGQCYDDGIVLAAADLTSARHTDQPDEGDRQ